MQLEQQHLQLRKGELVHAYFLALACFGVSQPSALHRRYVLTLIRVYAEDRSVAMCSWEKEFERKSWRESCADIDIEVVLT